MSIEVLRVIALALVALLACSWLYRRAIEWRQGWRVRCIVAGRWAYEEKKEGAWVGFTLEELGDHRESPHTLAVPRFPSWAEARREQILARLKSEFKSPRYVLKEA